jgi:ferric-dicitrate binding protein FerR (iron transport regulator)
VNGVVQSMNFYGGKFQLTKQTRDGTTVLTLVGGTRARSCAPSTRKGVRLTQAVENARTVRSLWGNGHGKFQIKGKYAAATVRGTWYHVVDRCDGTLVHVRRGIVAMLDLKTGKTVFVIAGQSYLVLTTGEVRHS